MTGLRHWRVRIFIITWLAYAGFYLTRKGFSVAKPELRETLHLSKPELAGVDTAYNIAYACGMFGFGMLADRVGTRKVVLTGMLISVLAGAAMGFSTLLLVFGLLMSVQGLVQSTGWGPLAKNLSAFVPRRERGLIMGLWCTNYSLGGVIANAIAGNAAQRFGWPGVFWVPALVLLGVWLLFLIFQRNSPQDVGLPGIDDETDGVSSTPAEATGWKDIFAVLRHPVVLLLCGVYFALKPIRYLFLQWGPLYIHDRLGTDIAESAIVSGAFEVGGPLGALAAGFISDKVFKTRRIPVIVLGMAAVAVCLAIFGYLPASTLAMAGMLALMGFFLYAADSLVTGAAAVDFGAKAGAAATAAGVVNGAGSIGQILGGLLPALVGDKPGDWNPLFWGLAVGVGLAALTLLPRWNALPDDDKKVDKEES